MLIHVAVPVPTLDLLTYRVPGGIAAPAIGARVVVPLGARVVTGIVVDVGVAVEGVEESEIKPIRQLLDPESFVPPNVVALARWTAEYYAAGAGETITSVLPPKARGEQASGHKTIRVAEITAAGQEAIAGRAGGGASDEASEESPGAAPAGDLTRTQRRALELIAGTPHGIPTPQLAPQRIGSDLIARLVARGFVGVRHDRVDRDPFSSASFEASPS